MRQKHSDARGFTLIETSIALLVLIIALLGVAGVIGYTTRYNSGATDRALALVVAQQQMEKLQNSPFNSAELNASNQTITVTNAGFTYVVSIVITNTTTTRKTISIVVTPSKPSSPWADSPVTLTTQRSSVTLGTYIG